MQYWKKLGNYLIHHLVTLTLTALKHFFREQLAIDHVLLFFDRVCLRKDNCSVTRLDVFYCSSQQNFEKVAQLIGFFFCYFEKSHFYTKTALGTFRATFGYNWATFHSNIWSHWTPAAFPNT